MLALFSLRLATGLAGSLLVLSPGQVNPRFYRVHFLTILALAAVTLTLLWPAASTPLLVLLAAAALMAFLGSLSWSLEGAPAGVPLVILTTLLLGAALGLQAVQQPADGYPPPPAPVWLLLSDFTAAALLGFSTTAMLLGHSYLIFTTMAMTPLIRLLAGLFASLVLRAAVAGLALGFWTGARSLA